MQSVLWSLQLPGSNRIVLPVFFILLAFALWEVDHLRRTQRLLARRILAMDVPELSAKLISPDETPLEPDDLSKMVLALRLHLPELADPKKLLHFLEARGLTHKEIKGVIDILHAEEKKANKPA